MNCEVIKTLQLLVTIVMRNNKTIFNSAKVKFENVPVYLPISCTCGNKIDYLSWKGSTLIINPMNFFSLESSWHFSFRYFPTSAGFCICLCGKSQPIGSKNAVRIWPISTNSPHYSGFSMSGSTGSGVTSAYSRHTADYIEEVHQIKYQATGLFYTQGKLNILQKRCKRFKGEEGKERLHLLLLL